MFEHLVSISAPLSDFKCIFPVWYEYFNFIKGSENFTGDSKSHFICTQSVNKRSRIVVVSLMKSEPWNKRGKCFGFSADVVIL